MTEKSVTIGTEAAPQAVASGTAGPRRELSLLDSTSIIVGIIIGAGVYQQAPAIAQGTGSPLWFMLIWVIGGLISLCGAICYAELATMYPREGGDYVYLSRAFGRWAGFLFGWLQMAVVRPADIGVMAFAFAMYARQLVDIFPQSVTADPAGNGVGNSLPFLADASLTVYSLGAVIILTLINILGVKEGKWTQNILTGVKVAGILAIVGVAFLAEPRRSTDALAAGGPPFVVALIMVLFCFGGWNEMAYVAAEVKNPERNIFRALIVGTLAVTGLYLLLNGAFLYALGFAGVANSKAVAADTVATLFPNFGGQLISALVCISALGAVNGLIFTGARISYAVGSEHRAFAFLGQWNPYSGTPIRALALQGILACALILIFGSFLELMLYAAAAVYLFYFGTGLSLVVLRYKEPRTPRPYQATLYPLPVIVFCAVCAFLIYRAFLYRPIQSAVAIGLALSGIIVYWFSRLLEKRQLAQEPAA
ncbi:MAG: amino acid permease [Thermoguttaceae bacterium]|nr:amino acid permease [Thermoguttaceae bacterium]